MHGNVVNGTADTDISLREVVLSDFNRMAGFPTIVAQILGDAKRRSLMEALSARFPGIPVRGTTDRQLSSYLTYCRLKLDSLPDPAGAEAFFVATAISHINGRPDAALAAHEDDGFPAPIGEPDKEPGQGASPPLPSSPPTPPAEPHRISDVERPRHGARGAGTAQEITLLAGAGSRPGIPAAFARYLLPCPDPQDRVSRARWLSGEITSPDGVAISFSMSGMRDEDLLMDVEAEMSGDPPDFLRRHDATSMQTEDLMAGVGDVLGELSRRLDPTPDGSTLQGLRDGLVAALGVYRPATLSALQAHETKLVVGSGALRAAALVIAAEAVLLRDTDPRSEHARPAQRLMGNPSPDAALTAGLVAAHAFGKHLATGRRFPDALVDSLAELRLAQIMREIDTDRIPHAIAAFDAVFRADCLAPLDRYMVAKMEPDMTPAL